MKRITLTTTFVLFAVRLFFVSNAALASGTAQEQAKIGDEVMLNLTTLGEHRASALKDLSSSRAGGAPFAIQEIEIIDAFEAGLPIASIEADITISRALYAAYVAGKPLNREQQELLGR